MPDLPLLLVPVLAEGGDSSWLALLVSLGAIATSAITLVRMVLSQGKFTGTIEQRLISIEQKQEAAKTDSQREMEALRRDIQRDRTDAWAEINQLKKDNQACDRERGELKAAVEMWISNAKTRAGEGVSSPGRRSHPKEGI